MYFVVFACMIMEESATIHLNGFMIYALTQAIVIWPSMPTRMIGKNPIAVDVVEEDRATD